MPVHFHSLPSSVKRYTTVAVNLIKMNLLDVIKVLETYSPTKYAAEWDNVGLLIESSSQDIKQILLTNDLTLDVVNEAIESKINLILSYHPPIFKGLKSINQSSVRGQIISRCFENQISVYSPHTSYDVMRDGLNDWLIRPFAPYATRTMPIKISSIAVQENNYFGEGRILHFKQPYLSIAKIIGFVKDHLRLKLLRFALGRNQNLDTEIKSLACCGGSGSSVLQNVSADLYLTGEMSHHDILEATERGISVILTEHSNSERGYLADVVKHKLSDMLGSQIKVVVSNVDKDPIEIV